MKIKIFAVGKVKNKNLLAEIEELHKRIPFTEIIEIKDSDPKKEAEKILPQLKPTQFVIACSEEGSQFTSKTFSEILKQLSMEKEIVFIIGSATGLDSSIKQRADETMALSKMTFTHEMARLFLVEQVYRAKSILDGKKYHKE